MAPTARRLSLAMFFAVPWSARADPTPAPSAQPTMPEATEQAQADTRTLPLPDRIEAISATLVGRPYEHDASGEGVPPDADPIERFDAFDCVTFVEHVLATATGFTPTDVAPALIAWRYAQGEVDRHHRRHFMETQWLPAAVAQHRLVDVTADYGTPVVVERTLSPDDWARWSGTPGMALPDDALPVGKMQLAYLPLEAAQRAASDIAPGSVLLVVREDRPSTPLWITHLGFVLRNDHGAPIFRHASQMTSSRRVRDHHLRWYLEYLTTWTRWPVVGVAIFAPVDGPRVVNAPAEATSPR